MKGSCKLNPSDNWAHCVHPITEEICIGGEMQRTIRETICCHCGEKYPLTTLSLVKFHGKYEPTSIAVLMTRPKTDFTLEIREKDENGIYSITSSIPGLLLVGHDIRRLLADVPDAVSNLRLLNGDERNE